MTLPDDKITRRGFLRGVLVLVSGGVVVSVVGCGPAEEAQLAEALRSGTPTALQYPAVMPAPTVPPEPGRLTFFTIQEARTVEAITARILPGTADDPGAREAGVIYYIDYELSYADGFPEATYRLGPYAAVIGADGQPIMGAQGGGQGQQQSQGQGQQGQGQQQGGGGSSSDPTRTPPPAAEAAVEASTPTPPAGAEELQVIWVPEDQIERYGYQSILTPRDVYRAGVAAVDRYSREQFGAPFVELNEEQQDRIVGAMLDGSATGFEPLTPQQFFHTLRRHTAEGMFSDPVYGGNRGMVGWLLIGYPGAVRAYTPDEIRNPAFRRPPQGLLDLNHFHPGEESHDGVVLPLSGSDPETWHNAHEERNIQSEPTRP